MLHNIERRLKICYIPENALMNCLSLSASAPGDVLNKVSLDGVPPGTIAMSRGFSNRHQSEYVVLWNLTWPVVPAADILPEIPVTTTLIQVKATEPRRESACDQPLIRNAGTFTLERRDALGHVLETVTFENPMTVEPTQKLVLSGYYTARSEPIGEARVTRQCCPTRTNLDSGQKECLYKGDWLPAAKLNFEGKPYWVPAMFVNSQGGPTKELMDGIMEACFPTPSTTVPTLLIPAPESKTEDPFTKLWKEKDNA